MSERHPTNAVRDAGRSPDGEVAEVTRTDGPAAPTAPSAPRTRAVRGFLARRDPAAWGIGTVSFVLSLVFLGVNLAYNAGNFIPPLDDAYIHLQYASQIGNGHFLQYNTGDPISTGASSLLYVLVLGACYALGFQGHAFLPFAMGLGALCLALTAAFIYHIGRRTISRRVGVGAGLLVATNGALLWGSVSGMEVGFVAMLISANVLAFTLEAPRKRFVLTPLISLLAAITRPEAFIFSVALAAAMVWTALRTPRPHSLGRTLGRLALVPLPLLGYLGQMLLYQITTGTTSANGMQAKSLLYTPITYLTNVADETLTHFRDFLVVFSGLDSFAYVFPGTLIAAALGAAYVTWAQPTWRPLVLAMGCGLVLVLLAISTLTTAHSHHLRYVQPFMPILLLLAAFGVHALARLLPAAHTRRAAVNIGLTVALLFTVFQMPSWSIRLGQQAAGIRDQQVSINNWIKGHLPPDAVIAVNDVGAPAYFTNREIVDLIGLTTNRLTEPSRHGAGSLYEALSEMPEHRRPDYFSVFDTWSVYGLKDGLFADTPIIKFQLKSPEFSNQIPGSASACQAARYCNEVVIYKADWSSVGSGDRPAVAPAGEIRDYVDVANLTDEKRHSYRVLPAHQEFQPLTSLESVHRGGREIVDSGRHVVGGEVMTVRNLTPGEPVTITSRVSARQPLPNFRTGSRRVDVTVNGHEAGRWQLDAPRLPGDTGGNRTPVIAGDGQGWHETTFTIPGELVTDSSITVRFGPTQKFVAPYPDYVSYGYWFSQ